MLFRSNSNITSYFLLNDILLIISTCFISDNVYFNLGTGKYLMKFIIILDSIIQ